MQKHEKAALDAIKEALEPLGWEVRVEYGGRSKMQIWCDAPNRRERFTVSSSPSSREAVLFEARRWARKIGAGIPVGRPR